MGWRVTGSEFYLAPGASMRVDFWWDRPGDRGAQWAMGHPLGGEYGAIATERVAKKARCGIGQMTINGAAEYSCGDASTAYWTYYADLRNDDVHGCRFVIEGGGVR